ncbi:hypothetical protein TMatcc_009790 [Talaromyces marneffei ATCC 18224]|uniref:Histone H1 n=2 Tax=Talaromyces marneffei TaxID=37727 RepID=B6QT53_TALMQ|nr:uncharacterized protein EYB26_009023 [Talaromyces marneffei]EEA19653.1 histone H1 [Talaromyces marneffei ATCC 18224]KAE8547962.1 hypothetical protein EYB25_009755 [Talaromyces marneffei]QGA21313.1 hypothetical protein EYB26_009023 [Talaromyces marneffei]
MPPKKVATAAASKKAAPSHASYRDMIKDAIVSLKDRNGSSRQSIKKYVQSNNKITVVSPAAFDAQFNKAIKAGVEKGEFSQPKGPSGPVKLAKKEAAAKPVAKKPAAAKPAAPKKAAVKKATAAKPAKKATTTKKAPAKPKANTAKPRKTPTAAPAIVDAPKVETKTKSGRVTKTTAKPAVKKAAPKKATPKKA